VEQGLDAALVRKTQEKPSRKRILGPRAVKLLIKIAFSDPPEGCEFWTYQMLAEKLVEEKIVETISHVTVRRAFEEYGISPVLKIGGITSDYLMRILPL
jgi:hypothetical protein